MNAVLNLQGIPIRSCVEVRKMQAPTIGKIRPGIKVLKSTAKSNPKAVEIYESMVAAGHGFDEIDKAIESRCNLRGALIPKNVPYFTCRRSDFQNPEVADEILRLYGEDRGEGRKLYRFPVLFPFNDWFSNLPNEMTAWGTTGRKFFSEYGPDGRRYCKTYAKVEQDPHAQRAKRHFGTREIIFRADESIPDGVCDPERCPQYQAKQCNLSASFLFAIPEIKGLGLIELPTNSIYVLQKAYSAMQTVLIARGKLVGTRFFLFKREFEITRINEKGEPVRQKQVLTVLDADIDIGALLDAAEDAPLALAMSPTANEPDENAVVEAGVIDMPSTPSKAEVAMARDIPPNPHPSASPEVVDSLEDKRHCLSDLLKRLGIAGEEAQRASFQKWAQVQYGQGWVRRESDLDRVNARLVQALEDRPAFDSELRAAAMSPTSPSSLADYARH